MEMFTRVYIAFSTTTTWMGSRPISTFRLCQKQKRHVKIL